jgi:hypothetical protein
MTYSWSGLGKTYRFGGIRAVYDCKVRKKVRKGIMMVIYQDGEGRDLEATLEAEGFEWQLWVDLETKDAVVRKRFPNNMSSAVGKVEVPPLVDDYKTLLKTFVESCAREGCGHSKSEHDLGENMTGPCRHDSDETKVGFVPTHQVCKCQQFLPRS